MSYRWLGIGFGGLIVSVAVLLALTSFNQRFAAQSPGGNDFLPRWLGTRLWLTEGRNPYSVETTLAIQQMIYGRPARVDEDQSLFVYPAYTMFLVLPFARLDDYTWARAAWMTLLEVALLGLAVVALRLADWHLRPLGLAIYLLFAVLWYHAVRALINGNAVVLVVLCAALAAWSVRQGQDGRAGVWLALATIKPQVVVLVVIWTLWWAAWHRRKRLIISWLLSIIVLNALAAVWVPDWWSQNIAQIFDYPNYTVPGTPAAVLAQLWPQISPWVGRILSLALIGTAVYLMWTMRQVSWRGFLWLWCWLLASTPWSGLQTDATNFLALFCPLVLLMATLVQQDNGWLSAALGLSVFLGLWALFLVTVQYGEQPQQHPLMFVPLPLLVMVGLAGLRRRIVDPGPHRPVRAGK
jgi:hypothetical protein